MSDLVMPLAAVAAVGISYLRAVEPSRAPTNTQVLLATLGGVLSFYLAKKLIQNPSGFKEALLGRLIQYARKVPGVAGAADKQLQEVIAGIEQEVRIEGDTVFTELPETGWTEEEIIRLCTELYDKESPKWKSGRVSGAVYHGGEEHVSILNQVYSIFSLSNPLHPEVFPSTRKFEAEIVSMAVKMLGDVDGVVGAVTSGGTESILMGVKAHREYMKSTRGIERPEMLVPNSAHAAFHKAGHYFGIKVIVIDLKADGSVDTDKMRSCINSNTILLVGSAPSYAAGVVDDIPTIARMAKEHGIGCHVDGCLGGFILPWFKKLEEAKNQFPNFDFTVEGVTSMSADTHKFGYAVKGTSVVLFRNRELREHMYFVLTDWPGGIYASPSIAGSRPGGLIAATWASLMHMGKSGFLENARQIWATKENIKNGVAQINDFSLLGSCSTMMVAFTTKSSSNINIFDVMDRMSQKGWSLNPLQRPDAIHLCITVKQIGKEEEFLQDLRESVEETKSDTSGKKTKSARVYGLAHGLPDRTAVREVVVGYLDACLKA